MKKIDVCIPAFYPGYELEKIIKRLALQTVRINRLLICNTDADGWSEELDEIIEKSGLEVFVYHISPEKFDHGRVRDELIRLSDADYVLFMTQDAYPYDDRLIEEMVKAIEGNSEREIAAAYARQLPKPGSDILERYSRLYNYPGKTEIKSIDDLETRGIKTFYCSNVCAMYKREVYMSGKGFPQRTIFNEDMIHARELIDRGYAICYAADARVFHSHSYTFSKQLHRNFDLAYSQAQFPEVFGGISSESEGIKYVRCVLGSLAKKCHFISCIKFCFQCVAKYAGFFLGKRADRLPKWLVLKLTDSPKFFK